MRLRFAVTLAATLSILAVAAPVQSSVYYVDGDTVASGTGTSWHEAVKTLAEAIILANSSDEIWIKTGIYPVTSQIIFNFESMEVYGGFAGGEVARSQRDWVANPTILDGSGYGSGSCVAIINGAQPTLDGLTIQNCSGAFLGAGGALNISAGPIIPVPGPLFRNMTFHANGGSDLSTGGAISISFSNFIVVNSSFWGNQANRGGAIHVEGPANPFITNSTFSQNSAVKGGAVASSEFGDPPLPTITNSILWGDSASVSGPELHGTFGGVSYNDINQTGYGDAGGGPDANQNIRQNPQFFGTVRPHLRDTSPCIDAGWSSAFHLPTTDFDGDSRIIDGDGNGTATPDMGADEFVPGTPTGIWYVDPAMTSSGLGNTWATAKKTIDEAVTAAAGGDEVWVKQGTYTPSWLEINKTLGFYGGFAGGESQLKDRDWTTNRTIIDGGGTTTTLWVNAANVILDGFVFQNGADQGNPYTGINPPLIRNCEFSANSVRGLSGPADVDNCLFSGNTAAMAIGGSGRSIVDSVFVNNSSTTGPPIVLSGAVERCFFLGNSNTNSGSQKNGAIRTDGTTTVSNSLFVGNAANGSGGAIYKVSGSGLTVENTTFHGNSTGAWGGAICADQFDPAPITVVNSVFWGDVASVAPPDKKEVCSPYSITYSDVNQNGFGDGLGGADVNGNIRSDPLFIDPDGADNVIGTLDDNLRLGTGSPAVDAGDNTGIDTCSRDLDGLQRFLDDPGVDPDTGNGTAPIIDMGAYERGGAAEQYTLTMAVTGNGTTDPPVGAHAFPVCSEIPVTAIPDSGWTFTNWTGDVLDVNSASTSVSMLDDRSATANFFRPVTADSSITKSNHQEGVTIGSSIIYTVVVSNAGPDDVTGASVEDSVPGELTCTWTCVVSGGASCTASPSGSDLLDTADIPAGDSVTYTGACEVSAGASGTLENTATVSLPAGGNDPDPANNSATDSDALSTDPPTTRELFGEATGTETFEAQQTIMVTDFVVKAGATVTLRAGQAIILGSGFVVEDGATLIIEIDPTLAP